MIAHKIRVGSVCEVFLELAIAESISIPSARQSLIVRIFQTLSCTRTRECVSSVTDSCVDENAPPLLSFPQKYQKTIFIRCVNAKSTTDEVC
jgi:hypothetical protein